MILDACPDEARLLSLADNEAAEPEVQSHVDACELCRALLQRIRREISSLRHDLQRARNELPSTVAAPRPSCTESFPETIGPYRVTGEIGGGGQGNVYRAWHPNLSTEVAVKWSRHACRLSESELANEARLLADLRVDGVARVLDLGVYQERPYVVMELVRGRNLQSYVAEARLTPRQAAALIAKIARALAGAHARGVVHRDLKPANIVIEGDGTPKIIDFGMATVNEPWREPDAVSGGTVVYMAPEQATEFLASRNPRGNVQTAVGPRGDVFALGAILYYLLTDRPPYQAEEVKRELIERVSHGDFDRGPLEVSAAPPPLVRICLRAMAADPAERYQSAAAFAGDLERFSRPRRRPAVWLAATTVFVALVAMVWVGAARWIAGGYPSRQPSAELEQLMIEVVEKGGKPLTPKTPDDLLGCLPLEPGDELKLKCKVPKGDQVGAFWVGADGQLNELTDMHAMSGDAFDEVSLPREGTWAPGGPPGTIAIFVIADRHRPRLADVQKLFDDTKPLTASQAGPWPGLPAAALFVLNRNDVESFSEERPMGTSPFSVILDRMNSLREKLAERYECFWGLALTQQSADSPE